MHTCITRLPCRVCPHLEQPAHSSGASTHTRHTGDPGRMHTLHYNALEQAPHVQCVETTAVVATAARACSTGRQVEDVLWQALIADTWKDENSRSVNQHWMDLEIEHVLLTSCAPFRSSFVLAGSRMVRILLFTPLRSTLASSAIIVSKRPGAIIIIIIIK